MTGRLRFDKGALMHMWRYAVITYLREALRLQVLKSDLRPEELKWVLTTQNERWWNIDISPFMSKTHFLRYAGRYVRRLPITQDRIVDISDQEVWFWRKDLKEKRQVLTRYSIAEFVLLLGEHVQDRYRNSIRYFGLLAPRLKAQTAAGIHVLLGQTQPSRPKRLSWASCLQEDFGADPLIDKHGQRMRWAGRLDPIAR